MAKPTIFISYSHKDEGWKNKLVTQLGVLQQQDYLDIWVDTRIEGGADWYQEIKEAIEATSIAVLLISANFLNSKFITEQEIPLLLQQQRQKGLRIYPIILTPCDWLAIPWITESMARPKDGRPLSTGDKNQIETDLAAIATEIRELLQKAGLPREKREYVPLPPDQIYTAKLPPTHPALFGREKELKLLDKAWANQNINIISFVAWGGVGKTALVNEWLSRISKKTKKNNYRGAERVYGWSFYSQGTREDKQASADTFFDNALKFFGYTGEPITSPWDKGVLLAKLIRERKTLLILDGMEPLQYPPGVEEGRLRDQGLQALLKELARFNNGLCLITTRCKVSDIEHTVGKTTHQIELENLSPQAGRQLLREAGVSNGTDKELEQAATEYGGHALALILLGRYLAIRYGGEIRKRDSIKKLAYEQTKQGVHARHVMDSYESWLKGTAELELLYIMGLFDRPAPMGAMAALKQPPAIKGLTENLQRLSDEDWDFCTGRLRDLHLLSASEADKLDCHPLIREHFGQKLKAKGEKPWKKAHERLYEYYKHLPEKELPDTLDEMEPLFAAVAHGCQAGKHQEAEVDVFFNRIYRKNEKYTVHKLGAFGSDLSALSNFFETPWNKIVPNLTDADKAVTLSWAGFGLRALGRLREAAQPMQAGLEMRIKQKNWKESARAAGNLSELYLTLGEVAAAVSSARQSVDFADRSGDEFEKESDRTALADALHQAGELAQAGDWFRQAEAMQHKRQPGYRYLYSLRGFRFCDLLLAQGKVREVLERYQKFVEWRLPGDSLLSRALEELSAGRAYLLEAVGKMDSTSEVESIFPLFQQAADYLNQAVAGLREAGTQHELPRALFARAFCYRIQNQFPQAWGDLAEAQEIAERGDMKLWLVDYHLEAARVVSSQLSVDSDQSAVASQQSSVAIQQSSVGSWQVVVDGRIVNVNREEMIGRLKMHVAQAAELVQKTGYHRRDPEVELGYAGLFLAQEDQVKAREHLGKANTLLNKMGIRCWDFEVRRLEQLLGN